MKKYTYFFIFIGNIEYSIHKQESCNLLLKPIKKIIINKIDDLTEYDFCFSQIISCLINDKLCDRDCYKSIINDIYFIIDDPEITIKNTTLDKSFIKKIKSGSKKYIKLYSTF